MKLKRILKWGVLLIVAGLLAIFLVAYARSTNDCGRPLAAGVPTMKAYTFCDYGTADALKLEEIEKPTPADDQVLVRVHAASVNPLDWHYLSGTPYVMRFGVGLRKPKVTRIGVDYAGTVEAVGKSVTRFKPGDEVFGGHTGAFAQYVCARAEGSMTAKPPGVTFEQASAIPIAGVTALQGLRDRGMVQAGEKVLINGASGGVGTFAVQIAKLLGAEVTGVCSTHNIDLVKSLGADHVIDYTKEDFTKGGQRYDVLLDNVANRTLMECRSVLGPKGRYVLIGGGGVNDQGLIGPLARPIKAMILSWFVSQKMGMLFADLKNTDLATLGDWTQSGKIKPVIDKTYSFAEVPAAVRYLEDGHARGKVVVTVE